MKRTTANRLMIVAVVVGLAAGIVVGVTDPFWFDAFGRFTMFGVYVFLIAWGITIIRERYLRFRRRRGDYL